MWEMKQLGRRAGALDVDLISNRPEVMTLLPVSAKRLDERDVAMFESCAEWVGLISLLSTGEARGRTRCCGVFFLCEM